MDIEIIMSVIMLVLAILIVVLWKIPDNSACTGDCNQGRECTCGDEISELNQTN